MKLRDITCSGPVFETHCITSLVEALIFVDEYLWRKTS